MREPSGTWPPPSESARVRGLLTLAEGLVVGSGLGFVLLIGSAFTSLVAGPSPVTVGGGVLLAVFLALTARNLWFFGRVRHSGENRSGGLANDFEVAWRRTRSTLAVLSVAALVWVAFGTAAGLRWGWTPVGWLVLGSPVLVGVLWFGFLLRLYVTYRVRGSVH